MVDSLEAMLKRQWELEKTYRPQEAERGYFEEIPTPDYFPVDLNTRCGQDIVRDAMFRMVAELFEAENRLKNKPWKTKLVETDEAAFFEEVSDFWHFTLRFFLLIFGTPERASRMLSDLYFHKADVNKTRQETGY